MTGTSNDRFKVNSNPEIEVIYLREHLIYLIMCINDWSLQLK